MSEEQVDQYIVHLGGFLIDISVGILFCFNLTRPIGYFFCALFNLMNSQMFAIGMFPFVMLAVLLIFSKTDWPQVLINFLNQNFKKKFKKPSLFLNYEASEETKKKILKNFKINRRHKVISALIILYIIFQAFLPFSHFITKGYNTWTNGLYGYSWDMMVNNWRILHKRILVINKSTGQKYYLNPSLWSPNNRWTHHADMAKQFSNCIIRGLKDKYNMTDVSIYMDIWISLNGRVSQRIYDPRVDIVEAEWSTFTKPTWVLPLLTQFTHWRDELKSLEKNAIKNNYSLIFLGDFPGKNLFKMGVESFLKMIT